MAKYRARFEMGGAEGRAMDWLRTGDELSLISAFGKEKKVRVKETYTYEKRRVYVTDAFGVIFADELVPLSIPVWNKTGESRQVKAV